ncbi:GMC oxidoreductase [Arthrobacter sp. SD76]|uniref:GMC oxidoreductase n=1 Tax=Arthrobacter sp. SD76 TaxID=3415007 RepID=UPI003C75C528
MSVLIIEAGPAHTPQAGTHLRNTLPDDDFNRRAMKLLVPHAGSSDPIPGLPGTRGIHALGGMMIGWSHAVPRPQLPAEWDETLPERELTRHLADAEALLWASADLNGEGSRRQQWLESTIESSLGLSPKRVPVAARRTANGQLEYAGADALLAGGPEDGELTILTGYVAQRIEHHGGRGVSVTARGSGGDEITASGATIVVGAGAVGTPQLLFASGLRHPALGRYMTDHLNLVSTVTLNKDLPEAIDGDAPVNLYLPVTEQRPFHTSIIDLPSVAHTGMTFGDDSSRITNIGTFLGLEPAESNGLRFSETELDGFGLPAVTAHKELSQADHERVAQALADQYTLASTIGQPWEGMASFLRPIGSALHLMGTNRIGLDENTSVASPEGLVRGTENIYVVGNGALGSRNSCNPTLTTVALALHAAESIG